MVYCGRPLSRLASTSTHVLITVDRTPFGIRRFGVDFLEFVFSTEVDGPKEEAERTHTSVPWSEIPKHPRVGTFGTQSEAQCNVFSTIRLKGGD